jgi:hypothetical protein
MRAFMIEVTQNETTRWINAAQIKTIDRMHTGAIDRVGAAIRLMDGEVYCVQESVVVLIARVNGIPSNNDVLRALDAVIEGAPPHKLRNLDAGERLEQGP